MFCLFVFVFISFNTVVTMLALRFVLALFKMGMNGILFEKNEIKSGPTKDSTHTEYGSNVFYSFQGHKT